MSPDKCDLCGRESNVIYLGTEHDFLCPECFDESEARPSPGVPRMYNIRYQGPKDRRWYYADLTRYSEGVVQHVKNQIERAGWRVELGEWPTRTLDGERK